VTRRDTLLFVVLCAIWGFSFVALKTALAHADPIFLGSIRFWVPGTLVAGGLAMTGRRVFPKREELPGLLLLGLTNTALLQMFLNLGQERISVSLGSILFYTYPLMAAVASPIFLGERLDRTKVAGLLLGFGGVVLIAGFSAHGSALGMAYMLLAAAMWAVGTIIFKKIKADRDVYFMTAWSLLFGAAFLSILSAAIEGFPRVESTWLFWGPFLYIAIPGMAIAGTLWYYLLDRGEAAVASAYLFLTPVFGVVFGWLVLDEDITALRMAGGVLIAIAIYLVNRTAHPATEADTRSAEAA
jgi:drug/metabolite transporter (DMT)-like permease